MLQASRSPNLRYAGPTIAALMLVTGTVRADAQSPAPADGGAASTVVGAVSVVLKSGAVQPLARNTVHLTSDFVALDSIWTAYCRDFQAEWNDKMERVKMARIVEEGELEALQALQKVPMSAPRALTARLAPTARDSAAADARGQFAFPNVAPGRYALFTASTVGDFPRFLLRYIDVRGTGTERFNLGKEAERTGMPIACAAAMRAFSIRRVR